MNLLLLSPSDFYEKKLVRLSGRRLNHLQKILKAAPGSTLKAGLVNGPMGSASVLTINPDTAELEVNLEQEAPPALPVTLILALPRPKVLRRVLRNITVLGVKRLHLINSWRVEKSYWQSPVLEEEKIHNQLILGLEQVVDTIVPEVSLHRLFKPFVEDELEEIAKNSLCYVAHPGATLPAPTTTTEATTLIVGPEGGFIPYEIDGLVAAGFNPVSLGPRILNVEVAITALLSR